MKVNNKFSGIASENNGTVSIFSSRLFLKNRNGPIIFHFLLAAIFLMNPLNVYCAQENESSFQESANDKISLDLKNVDIVELLRIISLKTGKTIVPSKEVAGRITVYLSNVAFNDVLDIILLTQGLALNRKDNIYYVMSEPEYRKIFGQEYVDQRKIQTVKLTYAKPSVVFTALGQLKSDVGKIVVDESSGTIILIDIPEKLELFSKMIKDLDQPLTTTVYDLNYMKAADAKTQFGAAITPGTGEVIIDERSGKAIITDLSQKMRKMNMLVRELDEPSRQIYVEADIVELSLSDEFERGIDWAKVFDAAIADGLAFTGYFPATLTAAYQKISVGTLATENYKAILNFLDTYGKTNVISQPRIAIVNNEEGNVMVGLRQPYITQTQSQATSSLVTSESVEFIDVGVKLKIVPKIGADGFITMKIKPEVSSIVDWVTSELSEIPVVQTAQSETVVKIKDGTMIMIAGMTRIEDVDTLKGWPGLAKVPFVGLFFGYHKKMKKRTEVIIFLTPHLSSGDVGLRGDKITEIVPMEHLPAALQNKVVRDKSIDRGLYYPENMKEELKKKQALELATEETTARTAEKLARIEEEKAAKQAVKQEAVRVVRAAAQAEKEAAQAAKEAERIKKAAEEVISAAKRVADNSVKLEAEKAASQAVAQANQAVVQANQAAAQATEEAQRTKKEAEQAIKAVDEVAKRPAKEAQEESVIKQAASVEVKKPRLEETAKDCYQKGLRAQADSNIKEAISNFIRATELDNKYAAAYNSLGIIYEQEFKFEKAEAMYLKAIAVDSDFSPAYANLALLNEDRADFVQALAYWKERAQHGDPDDPWTIKALERIKELEN